MAKREKKQLSLSGSSNHQDFFLLCSALDACPSGIVITDNNQLDNPIIYCNAAFTAMSGYHEHEIIGRNCRFLQGEDRAQHARVMLKQAVLKGSSCKVELRNYRKNGDLFWNELFISPIKDETGNITHFMGVQNDITARKKNEQDLLKQQQSLQKEIVERISKFEDSQKFLSSILETVRESLLVLDDNYVVLSANEHFFRTFKVNQQETIGKQLYELGNHQWDIPKLKELLFDILPTNNPVENFEVDNEFPQIGRKVMLLNAHRIELDGAYKDQILIAIEDITERKEVEQRKDDFLAIASHEFKTPLTTIKGYLQAFTRSTADMLSEKQKQLLEKIILQTTRLNTMVIELLDVAKIKTGNLTLNKTVIDLNKLIRETMEIMQSATPNHSIELHTTGDISLLADEPHIAQVLNNLLSNAIKYAPDSNKVVIYATRIRDHAKVSVKDFGLGISISEQKRIFERFYRAGEVQQKYAGMGVGLYICEQIIKEHDGSLWVESEPGKGSTFSFTLPVGLKEYNEE